MLCVIHVIVSVHRQHKLSQLLFLLYTQVTGRNRNQKTIVHYVRSNLPVTGTQSKLQCKHFVTRVFNLITDFNDAGGLLSGIYRYAPLTLLKTIPVDWSK